MSKSYLSISSSQISDANSAIMGQLLPRSTPGMSGSPSPKVVVVEEYSSLKKTNAYTKNKFKTGMEERLKQKIFFIYVYK